jgi:hypothetical protein
LTKIKDYLAKWFYRRKNHKMKKFLKEYAPESEELEFLENP